MARFLVVFMVFFVMYWTWGWVHAPERDQQLFIHSELKSKIQEMLGEAILAQRPQAREIEFISFWTESKSPKKIQLFFTYRFVDNLLVNRLAEDRLSEDKLAEDKLAEEPQIKTGEGETETIEPNKENMGPVYQEISGKAFLSLKSKNSQMQNWLLEKIVTTQDKLAFTKEFIVRSKF